MAGSPPEPGGRVRRVVAGVADTDAGQAAVRRAVVEARDRGCALHLVRVWREIDCLLSLSRTEVARLPTSERANQLLLERAAWQVGQLDGSLQVTTELVPGDLYAALVEQSQDADLLVVGVDQPGEEVAGWLHEHAQCPVLLVRPEPSAATAGP